MATSVEYIEFVCQQISFIGEIRYRKMFGEYLIYLNNKPLLLVCDNMVFVKKFAAINSLMKDGQTGYPYDGAKEHYILDIEDKELVLNVLNILKTICSVTKYEFI